MKGEGGSNTGKGFDQLRKIKKSRKAAGNDATDPKTPSSSYFIATPLADTLRTPLHQQHESLQRALRPAPKQAGCAAVKYASHSLGLVFLIYLGLIRTTCSSSPIAFLAPSLFTCRLSPKHSWLLLGCLPAPHQLAHCCVFVACRSRH